LSVWYFETKSSTFDTKVFYDHDIFACVFDVMYSGEYNVFDVTLNVYHTGQAEKLA
jgi:hypothetical protein